jgi:hypothetical protein
MPDRVIVCAGTKRGLFVFESNRSRSRWTRRGPFLTGWQIFHAVVDTRGTPRVHAAASSDVFGCSAFSSNLTGRKWVAAKKPPMPPKPPAGSRDFARKYGIPMNPRIWHIEPGRAGEKGVLYAGTAPAGLFRSEDSGKTWRPMEGLLRHRSRKLWMPGAGGMCLHSIQLDPKHPKRLYVAISSAGGYRSDDGGKTWKAINQGIRRYAGTPKNEVGTCVHKLLLHPSGRLYQQNHIGVYRSDDAGESWQSIDRGLPSDFGFGLAVHPRDPRVCWVVPLEPQGYAYRATRGAFRVYGRRDSGWQALGRGLPEDAYLNVLREGMASDPLKPCGVYVGTGGGHVFHSADEGKSWRTLAQYLPAVLSVSVAVV